MHFLLKTFTLCIVLISVSGCPFALTVTPGLWIFSESFFLGELAIVLIDGGATVSPDPNTLPSGVTTFGGTVTWMQNGNRFAMHQDNGQAIFDYTATVTSATELSGVLRQSGQAGEMTGTFTARRVDL